jgi:hypothetical protein
MRTRFVPLLLLLACPALGAPWWPWQRECSNPEPQKTAMTMLLVHDLTGDTIPEGVLLEQDRHTDRNPVFSVCTLEQEGREARVRERLLTVQTAGDYCRSIRLRDIDGDNRPEILIRTVSRDGIHEYLTIIRYAKDAKTFRECRFSTPPGSNAAVYTFTPRRGARDPELTVTSRDPGAESVFRSITGIDGKVPHVERRQTYRVSPTGLLLDDQETRSTPFAALEGFLRALARGKRFVAYKFVTTAIELDAFKKMVDDKLASLFGHGRRGTLELTNWHLEYFRERRTMGWMTFSHSVPAGGKNRIVDYQIFLKKEYDEWKITLIRVIRTRTL